MWYFYLINVIENLNYFCMFVCVLGGIALIFIIILFFCTLEDEDCKKINKHIGNLLKIGILIYIICVIIKILLPDKNTMYLMAGAKATEMLAATPEASKAREVLNLELDKILTELKDKK